MKIYRQYRPDRRLVLYPGNSARLLARIPDNSIDLTITSPPYCMGKEYDDSTSTDDFEAAHDLILPEIVRVTKI